MNNFLDEMVWPHESEKGISYVLAESDAFFNTGYKLLLSGSYKGLLVCTKIDFNGRIKLVYLTEGFRRLGTVLNAVDEAALFKILTNLLSVLVDIKDNNLLTFSAVDFSADRIFVDIKTCAVYLIYLPVKGELPQMAAADRESELRARIVSWLKPVAKRGGIVYALMERFCDAGTDLKALYREYIHQIDGGFIKEKTADSNENSLGSESAAYEQKPEAMPSRTGIPAAEVIGWQPSGILCVFGELYFGPQSLPHSGADCFQSPGG